MRYKLFGKSGLRVSELALGTMTFGTDWGWGASKEESRKIFDLFLEHGGNFIDTACNYTNGTSEKFVGEFIASERDSLVVATKYTARNRDGDPNAAGNHRKNMVQSVEGSLRRLGTDYIDLLWLHAWDYTTPVQEVMRAFDDLVRYGKVLYIGISDTPAWIVSQAVTMAELRGWSRFVGLQIPYSLVQREVERELLPMARALELAVTPWGCLGAGVLTGKFSTERGGKEAENSRLSTTDRGASVLTDRNLSIGDTVSEIAEEIGCTPPQVALSWVRQQMGIIIPILGARTARQLKDNLGCLGITLSEDHLRQLDEASMIELGFPHEFVSRGRLKDIMYAGTYDLLDIHRRIR
jgi:aryl-alcohol dehydrogenase-like predicted oxidoreductase